MDHLLKFLWGGVCDEVVKRIESIEDSRGDSETYGLVRLCGLSSVTESMGLALPASEKNPATEGTLAHKIEMLQKIENASIQLGEDVKGNSIRGETAVRIGNAVHVSIDIVFNSGIVPELKKEVRLAKISIPAAVLTRFYMIDLNMERTAIKVSGLGYITTDGDVIGTFYSAATWDTYIFFSYPAA